MIRESLDLVRKVGVVTRYSMAHLNREESVLEHTGGVALLAMLIGLKCNADIGELLQKAVIHDIEESQIGDIASPVKYHSVNILNGISALGNKVVMDIALELNILELVPIWFDSKDGTLEGRIVKFCDIISVLGKIHEEVVMYSNISIKNYAQNTLEGLEKLRKGETNEHLKILMDEAIEFNKELI